MTEANSRHEKISDFIYFILIISIFFISLEIFSTFADAIDERVEARSNSYNLFIGILEIIWMLGFDLLFMLIPPIFITYKFRKGTRDFSISVVEFISNHRSKIAFLLMTASFSLFIWECISFPEHTSEFQEEIMGWTIILFFVGVMILRMPLSTRICIWIILIGTPLILDHEKQNHAYSTEVKNSEYQLLNYSINQTEPRIINAVYRPDIDLAPNVTEVRVGRMIRAGIQVAKRSVSNVIKGTIRVARSAIRSSVRLAGKTVANVSKPLRGQVRKLAKGTSKFVKKQFKSVRKALSSFIKPRQIKKLPVIAQPRNPKPVTEKLNVTPRDKPKRFTKNNKISAAQARSVKGTATGGEFLSKVKGPWLKGKDSGLIPKQIANKLKGREFKNFKQFRKSFWKEISKDKSLFSNFSKANQKKIRQGLSPIAPKNQWHGKRRSYELHHIVPINKTAKVYDMDNLLVTSPKLHISLHKAKKVKS